MADFHQSPYIATLHNLNDAPIEKMEAELSEFSAKRSLGLVLPSLYSELEGDALTGIVDELSQVPYLSQIVIGLDRADRSEYTKAVKFFRRLPQNHRVLWHDGPRLRAIDSDLAELGLAPTEFGKGRNVWYCRVCVGDGKSRRDCSARL